MKVIARGKIERTVKKEYKAARDFVGNHYGRYSKMMIDVSSGKIWSDVFLNEGDYKIYHSDSIMGLQYLPGLVSDTENAYIDDAIRKLREAGWEIK